MDEDEREEVMYHGTTYDVAQSICARKTFEQRETHFASTRDLALLFATRSSSKRRLGVTPALVKVVLYESDLKRWIRNGLVRSCGFDEGDQPSLRGKTQLIFGPGAIEHLNRYMFKEDLSVETGVQNA